MCSFFGSKQSETSEISSEEIIKFIRTVSLYKPVIHLGGGEPFMRRDIYEIIAGIKSQDMPLLITTNGYLLDVDKIKKLNIDYIIFSLYGPAEVHNKITEIKDAYQTAVEKIKALPKEKIIVSTIIMPENIDYLDEFIKKIIGYGINKIKIENLNYITPREYKNHDIKVNNYILRPTTLIRDDFPYPEVEKFWTKIEKLKTKYKGKIFLKPYLNKKEFFNWYLGERKKTSCNFIFHSVFINSNGDIIPCQFLENCSLGNITQDELKYIWQSQNFDRLRELINRLNLPVCKRCCK
jgi:MoaA/NifB/PqqE/SkfB family radical SAM enzyme